MMDTSIHERAAPIRKYLRRVSVKIDRCCSPQHRVSSWLADTFSKTGGTFGDVVSVRTFTSGRSLDGLMASMTSAPGELMSNATWQRTAVSSPRQSGPSRGVRRKACALDEQQHL